MGQDANKVLRYAWCTVLGVDDVDVQDNFFEFGGDSLAALEMATMIEDELGVVFPIEELFVDGSYEHLLSAVRSATQVPRAQ